MTLIRPDYNDRHDRMLYQQLFYNKNKLDRPLTQQEEMFVKDMYHQEEYYSGLDGDLYA